MIMPNTVFVKKYNAPPIDKNEILRYAGVRETTAELERILDECLLETENKLTYKVCYRKFNVLEKDGCFDIGFAVSNSKNLSCYLNGCHEILLFAATVGLEIDRLIARNAYVSPTKSLMLQAIGAERIESLCDSFSNDMALLASKNNEILCNRYSPGYGDFPLEMQKDIFAALDCSKNIGLSLNESLLMSPSKSVTAIIGVRHKGE